MSLIEQCKYISKQLKMSPSLKSFFEKTYFDAVELAIKETQLAANIFPTNRPYAIEQLLDNGFYPHLD